MKVYSFEKLDCWQQGRQLAVWTYQTTQSFPAEGTSRKTEKDQSHFSTISYSSTIELLNDLIIANDLKFLSDGEYKVGREKIEKQTLLIAGLRKSQSKSRFRSLLNFLNP